MKKYLFPIAFFVALPLLFAACSSAKYNTTRVQNLDFGQYRTYGWLPPVDSLSKDYFTNDIARDNIMSTANQEIESLGLTYSKENPDLLFRYVSIVNNRSRMVYSNPYWGGAWGMGWGPWGMMRPWGMGMMGPWGMGMGWSQPVGREKYRHSHLIIEAVDRETNSVVWQARGSSDIRNPERAINRLPRVVEGIFKRYPARR